MRTVRITSDGTPSGTFVVDDETGKEVACVAIAFDPIVADRTPWMATLLLLPQRAYETPERERVFVKVGLEPGRKPFVDGDDSTMSQGEFNHIKKVMREREAKFDPLAEDRGPGRALTHEEFERCVKESRERSAREKRDLVFPPSEENIIFRGSEMIVRDVRRPAPTDNCTFTTDPYGKVTQIQTPDGRTFIPTA